MDLLTDKQITVLKLLAEDKSCRKIADLLGKSTTTIQTHKKNIYSKLHLRNTLELTRFAIRCGIVSPNKSS